MARHPGDGTSPDVVQILQEAVEWRPEQLSPRDDHQIDATSGSLRDDTPEHLSNQSLRSVPGNGVSQFPGRHDPEPT